MSDVEIAGKTAGRCPAGPTLVMPFPRETVLDLAPLFQAVRSEAPAVRVLTPAGDPAWLVSRYEDVKALLDDERLARSHPQPERASRLSSSAILGGPEGSYATEQADHARLRRIAGSAFSARRMHALRPRVQGIVDPLLDTISASVPPADLHESFSLALSIQVICELLGVPFADRERFSAWFEAAISPQEGSTGQQPLTDLINYVSALIEERRSIPGGDDFIAHVLAIRDESGRVASDEIVLMVAGLLFAGHHSTATYLDLGAVLLLTDPRHRAAMQEDGPRAMAAVEEMLRIVVPGLGVTPRYARNDLRIGDVTVAAGDAVLLSMAAANHDGSVFAEPDRFNMERTPNPHIAFGHGRHFCIGASLARMELSVGLGSLFRRFPRLRLAVPVEALRTRREFLSGGLAEVPVTW